MRTILVLIAGCTEQNYHPEGYSTPATPTDVQSTAAPVVRADRYEWAAGSCGSVRVPAGAIVQLLDCNDLDDGTHQCWPDADQRLTLIDGVAYVLCPESDVEPDSYTLNVISVG